MLRKLGLVVVVVLWAAIVLPAVFADQPAPNGPDGDMKAGVTGDQADSAVPASSEWGMLIMVVLVLSASTAMLAGGGLFQRRLQFEFVQPTPEPATDEPERKAPRQKSTRKKGTPTFSHRQERSHNRKGANVSRQNAVPRRRGGPGCRGVR
jgi:hypothetical protein